MQECLTALAWAGARDDASPVRPPTTPPAPPAADPTCVFVYGTLMRGGRRHAALGGERFLGPARLDGHTLYGVGDPPAYPAALPAAHPDAAVHGELWTATPQTLRTLDRVEGVEAGLFRRVAVTLADGARAWCYLWGRDRPGRDLRPLGDRWDHGRR